MPESQPSKPNGKTWRIQLGLALVGVLFSLMAAVLAVQWQSAIDTAAANTANIEKLEQDHKADINRIENKFDAEISRLDESNRNQRNQIADLEERIAVVEERTR